MKKTILASIFILFSIELLFASDFSLDKSSKMLSGSFLVSTMGGKQYEDSRENNLFVVSASPRYSYFIYDNFAFGAELSLSLKSQGDQIFYWKLLKWKFGPRITYFFRLNKKSSKSSLSKINPYITFGTFFKEFLSEERGETVNEASSVGYSIDFGLGTLFRFGNSAGISTEISYSIEEIKSTSGNNLQFLIGINVFEF